MIQNTTIVLPVHKNNVLLGMKKRGFGVGWWNGFGGKLESGETFKDSAKRESFEEAGITIKSLQLVARLLFYFDEELKIASACYVARSFSGEPTESEEMRPQWFQADNLPFEKMWPADRIWVPQALAVELGTSPLNFKAYFDSDKNLLDCKPAEQTIIEEVFSEDRLFL